MTSSILHPAGWVENGDCNGSMLIRNQPSRESGNVQPIYRMPFRNIQEVFNTNWELLSPEERQMVIKSAGIDPNSIIQMGSPSPQTLNQVIPSASDQMIFYRKYGTENFSSNDFPFYIIIILVIFLIIIVLYFRS